MKVVGRAAMATAGIWLAGCGGTPGNLAGGRVLYRPGVSAPVLAVPDQGRGRVSLMGGVREARAGTVTLDNRGKVFQAVDDSLRLGIDATVRLSEAAGLRLTMESWSYAAEGYGRLSVRWADVVLHGGIRALRLATVRADSVYPGFLDLFGSARVDTATGEGTRFAPTGGATLALLPGLPVRPWCAWAVTLLPEADLESSIQPTVPTGGWMHELSAGLALGGATGPQAWGGGGVSLVAAHGTRSGWNASGGIGWGF